MTEKQKILLRKYLPFVGLSALTILLMIFFKVNSEKGAKIFEEGKVYLAEFYVDNLKPLFYEAPITKEDVFDFAVNNQIPIDKKDNKSLRIATDDSGEEYFQIIPTSSIPEKNTYQAYRKLLELNTDQQESLDSLLDSYKEDLYTAVLVNDNNTYAVNSELHILKKAITYDLYDFIYKVKPDLAVPKNVEVNQKKLDQFVYNFRTNDKSNFIVFAPDTILETSLAFDKVKLENDIENLNFNQKELEQKLAEQQFKVQVVQKEAKNQKDAYKKHSVVVRTDKANHKVIVVNDEMINIEIPQIDLSFLNDIVNLSLPDSVHIRMKADSTKNKFGLVWDIQNKDQDNASFAVGIDEKQIENLVKISLQSAFTNKSEKDWEKFGEKMDSLAQSFQLQFQDSSINININSSDKKKKSKVK